MDQVFHWEEHRLEQQLAALLPGLSITVVASSASTNTALLEHARVDIEAMQHPARVDTGPGLASKTPPANLAPRLLVAEHQTAGRGRLGRAWQSARGSSLTFSLSLALTRRDWSGLSLAVGVALADGLEEPSSELAARRIGLKWPNDLWLMDPESSDGRKIGGILIETVMAGPIRIAVVGIGLNISPLPETDLDADYSCLQELDPKITAPQALARIALPLVQALSEFNEMGFASFAKRFAARDLLRGRIITTTQGDLSEGTAQGVTHNGALRVHTASGLREVNSGEVSVRLGRNHAARKDGPC